MPSKPSGSPTDIAKRAVRKVARELLPTVQRAAGVTAKPAGANKGATAKPAPAQKLPADPRIAAAEALITGETGAAAWAAIARQLLAEKRFDEALSLGHSLRQIPGAEPAGRIVVGLCVSERGTPSAAWSVFEPLGTEAVIDAAPGAYFKAAFSVDPAEAITRLDTVLSARGVKDWPALDLVSVARDAQALSAEALSETLLDAYDALPASDQSKWGSRAVARERSWLEGGSRRRPIAEVPGAINFGVLSYHQPDHVSQNIGDSIQTIASLGHLIRNKGFTYTGDEDLVTFVKEAALRLKPERAVDSPAATFNLIDLYRDGNVYQQLPEPTWAVMFGWYLHRTYAKGYNLPFNPNLRPIPVSMFFRHPESLTPDAIEYLKGIGPIGCRDWQSVAMLHAAGVPAFFSGCITTTIDTLFAPLKDAQRQGTIFIDTPITGPGDDRTQLHRSMQTKSALENLRVGHQWVSDYADRYARVVTKRLHAYLPARSVGCDVDFLPTNPSDDRFGGLIDIDDQAFLKIRHGILDKLSSTLGLLASGADEAAVYAHWREITADEVASSIATLEAAGHIADRALGQGEGKSVQGFTPAAGAVSIVVDAPPSEHRYLADLVRSAELRSSGPLDWTIVSRTASPEVVSATQGIASNSLRWVTAVDAGLDPSRTLSQQQLMAITLAALDAPTAVVVPAAARLHADVRTLADVDLDGESLIAAAPERRKGYESGFSLLRRVASKQAAEHAEALEFQFQATKDLDFDFRAGDLTVSVLDLDALRAKDALAQVLGLTSTLNIGFDDALNLVVGSARADLPQRWNAQPAYGITDDAALVSWRRSPKPGGKLFTPGQ